MKNEQSFFYSTEWLSFGREVIEVPRDAMMSGDLAVRSEHLGDAIATDPILKNMANIALVLFVINEKLNPLSEFKPYLEFMPRSFTLPLSFDLETFEILKGSPVFEEAVGMLRNVSRHYGYFYQLLVNKTPYMARALLSVENFTYSAYCWAVGVVATRQNFIPSILQEKSSAIALIPFWDLANHSDGPFASDFNQTKNAAVCSALRDFDTGEQFTIFYGQRPNSEFLVHNGFVFVENKYDSVRIKLGLSRSDPHYERRVPLLFHYGLKPVHDFRLTRQPPHFPAEILVFVRIFQADPSQMALIEASISEDAKEGSAALALPSLGEGSEVKAWSYLRDRLALLLKVYPRTISEEDLEISSNVGAPSETSAMALQLVYLEQKILAQAVEQIQTILSDIKKRN